MMKKCSAIVAMMWKLEAYVAGGIIGARNKILAAESSLPFSSRLRRSLLAAPLSKLIPRAYNTASYAGYPRLHLQA